MFVPEIRSARPAGRASFCGILGLMLGLLASGCGERERLVVDQVPPVAWEFGPPTSYPVPPNPGGTIADSVSGCAFRFPAGGSGALVVARVLSGPSPVYEGAGFAVDYAGEDEVQVVVDPEGAGRVMVAGYGTVNGSFSDSPPDPERWLAVPAVDTLDAGIAFLLTLPYDAAGGAAPSARRRGFREYWISRIPAGSNDITKMIHLERQATAYVDSFLSAMPEPRRSALRAEATGRMHRHHEYDGYYYQGFWWRSLGTAGRLIRPTIHLRTDANAGNVAHETGHYITHLLVGDDVWSELEGQAPLWDTQHGPGDLMGRSYLVEDYAYFAEWFLTGSVKAYDLLDPYPAFMNVTPLGKDFPSLEGFAAFLLASLMRTTPTMRDLVTGRPTDVPAPAMDAAAVFAIIERGATDIDALRGEIVAALGAGAGEFPVIAQRTGWSYSVRGRLVGPTGQPAAGIATSSIYRAGDRTYEGGTTSLATNANGEFSIVGQVFPGRSFILCVDPPDTAEIVIDLDWAKPTDQNVNIGDRAVSFPPVVTGLSPESGEPGDAIEILGRRFGAGQGTSTVTFAGTAATASQWEDSRILVTVPQGAGSGDVVVTVGGLASDGHAFTVVGQGRWVLDSYEVLDLAGQNGTWLNINTYDGAPGGCSVHCGYDNPNFSEVWGGDWETFVECSWTSPAAELQPGSIFTLQLAVATTIVRDDEGTGEAEKSPGWLSASCSGQWSRDLKGTDSEAAQFTVDPAPTWMPDSARMLVRIIAGGYSGGGAGAGYSGRADRQWTYRYLQ